MEATVQDFMSGLLRECAELAEDWRRRRPVGADWRLARLLSWQGLAQALPEQLDSPNGPHLDLDPPEFRLMWSEARALRALERIPRPEPELMAGLVERIYHIAASRFDPPHAFAHEDARAITARWGEAQLAIAEPSLAQAAMAMLDFVRADAVVERSEQLAALFASVLPAWSGAPMVHVLSPDARSEEGYLHALEAARDGEEGAWIAYYLARSRRVLKRMTLLLDGTEKIRRSWAQLFRRAPFSELMAEQLASELVALPIITPSFVADTGIPTDYLRDAMVLLVAADQASEVTMPGEMFTVLPGPLKLLVG